MIFSNRLLNVIALWGVIVMLLSQSGCTHSPRILDQREHLHPRFGGGAKAEKASSLSEQFLARFELPSDGIAYFESIKTIGVEGWLLQFEDEEEMWQNYERFYADGYIYIGRDDVEQVEIEYLGEAAFGFPLPNDAISQMNGSEAGNFLYFARCNTLVWIKLYHDFPIQSFAESEVVKYAHHVDEAIQATLCLTVDE
jgi:hypothetical protein